VGRGVEVHKIGGDRAMGGLRDGRDEGRGGECLGIDGRRLGVAQEDVGGRPDLQGRGGLEGVNLVVDAEEAESGVGGGGRGDLQREVVGGVGGDGAGDVFLPVGDAVAVEVVVAVDEGEVPAVCIGHDGAGVELALFPGVGDAVAVGVDAECKVQ